MTVYVLMHEIPYYDGGSCIVNIFMNKEDAEAEKAKIQAVKATDICPDYEIYPYEAVENQSKPQYYVIMLDQDNGKTTFFSGYDIDEQYLFGEGEAFITKDFEDLSSTLEYMKTSYNKVKGDLNIITLEEFLSKRWN